MKKIICQECGREFEYHRKVKFCQEDNCQDINLRRRKYGVRQCEMCRKDYIPKRETSRFCSEPCTLDYGRYVLQGCEKAEEIPCPVCGKLFRATMDRGRQKQFCSKKCFVAVQPLLQSFERICVTCGTKYLTAEGYNSEYCSKGCKKAAYTLTCTICGKEYEAQNRNQAACSDECRKEDARRRSQELNKEEFYKNAKPFTCKECGKDFVNEYGEKRSVFCSDQCNNKAYKKTEVYKAQRKRSNRRRRARLRGVESLPYNDKDIFIRDGWVCQICGQVTDKRLKFPHPMSASLDHTIPLAKQGPDTPDNVNWLILFATAINGTQ